MKKLSTLLLLVSIVIGMAVPGMANPTGGSNQKTIEIDVGGDSTAENLVSQVLDSGGDQSNTADVATLVGDTNAISDALADATTAGTANVNDNTGDNNEADANDNDADAEANAGDANALGGIATSVVIQDNDVSQDAYAEIHNHQDQLQAVIVDEWQDASTLIEDAAIVENNDVDNASELDVDVSVPVFIWPPLED